MLSAVIVSTALLAGSAVASSLGKAVIINNCDYQVHLCAVPASGGGQVEEDRILNTGDVYNQQWTQLTNTMGWSIKLSKTEVMHNIMQYEYTYHGDNIIWYDMSEVDGNPWRGNFMITAQSDGNTCQPRQVAYRYATDDAYGMQDCAANSVITLTLCSGDNATSPDAGSSSAPPASSPVAYSSPAPPPPSSTPSTQSSYQAPPAYVISTIAPASVAPVSSSSAPAPTTSTYQAPINIDGGGDAVWTTFETVTETDWVTIDTTVTAYATVRKRHEHHPHHPHH